MEPGMGQGGLVHIHMAQNRRVKLRIIDTAVPEGNAVYAAHSELAAMQLRTTEIRLIRQAEKGHMVKAGRPEEIGRTALPGRTVIQLLVDDLQFAAIGALRPLKCKRFPAWALVIGLGQQRLLVQERTNALQNRREPGVPALVQLGQQFIHRAGGPALQNIVQASDGPGSFIRVIATGRGRLQAVRNAAAELQPAGYSFVVNHDVILQIKAGAVKDLDSPLPRLSCISRPAQAAIARGKQPAAGSELGPVSRRYWVFSVSKRTSPMP